MIISIIKYSSCLTYLLHYLFVSYENYSNYYYNFVYITTVLEIECGFIIIFFSCECFRTITRPHCVFILVSLCITLIILFYPSYLITFMSCYY